MLMILIKGILKEIFIFWLEKGAKDLQKIFRMKKHGHISL